MPKLTVRTLLVGLFILGLFCSPAVAELDELVMYDDFNARSFNGVKKCIDPTKWYGAENGDFIGEVERVIKSKRAVVSIRAWGDTSDDVGRQVGRNIMKLKDAPSNITGVCFTPRVKKIELDNCDTNETRFPVGRVRYVGTFYSSVEDSVTMEGVVIANIWFDHVNFPEGDERFLKKDEFQARGNAVRCANDDCSIEDWGTGETLDFGLFKKSNKTEFCVAFDPDTEELVFSAGDDVRYIGADQNLPTYQSPVDSSVANHAIQTRVDIPNCTTGGMRSGYIEADIDNVKVRRREL